MHARASAARPRRRDLGSAAFAREGGAGGHDRPHRGHARHFADALRAAGCEILNDVALDQVPMRFGDDEATIRAIDHIQREGTCWYGGAAWQGRGALRVGITSWVITAGDLGRSLRAIVQAMRCEAEPGDSPVASVGPLLV